MTLRLLRLFGGLHTRVYRWTKGRIGGHIGMAPVLLLTVAGRRTGRRRTTPLLYGRSGDDLVVIASVGGAPRHPAWYLNLRDGEADVELGGEHRRVRARDAVGEERDRLWAAMLALYPAFESYERRTTRRIPVVVLETVR